MFTMDYGECGLVVNGEVVCSRRSPKDECGFVRQQACQANGATFQYAYREHRHISLCAVDLAAEDDFCLNIMIAHVADGVETHTVSRAQGRLFVDRDLLVDLSGGIQSASEIRTKLSKHLAMDLSLDNNGHTAIELRLDLSLAAGCLPTRSISEYKIFLTGFNLSDPASKNHIGRSEAG